MNLRRSALLLCLSVSVTSAAAPLFAADKKPKPKQEAKDYYEQATKQTDPAIKADLACQAMKLEPKEKKYSEECNKDQAALSQMDAANLQAAKDALQAKQYDKAEASARSVRASDEKLHSQAMEIINQVENAKHLSLVDSSWVKGDFDGVKANAPKVTDPGAQATVKKIVDLMETYNGYMSKGRSAEGENNPEEAKRQYLAASQVNPRGPGDPQGRISALNAAIEAKRQAALQQQQQQNIVPEKPQPPPPGQTAGLVKSAKEAEKAGRVQEALSDYQAVLAAEPKNFAALAGVKRLEPIIQAATDRAAVKKAISDFYQFKLDDAQRELDAYLKATPAPLSPGVANFYLGATLLEQAMLNTPQARWQGAPVEAQTAFKEARKDNFTPSAKYVSPALMKAWDATAQ
jgi:tetratricopeptide (TPR) repeat protein